jgi:DNA uptake protein ComE-like DNA-binding protein
MNLNTEPIKNWFGFTRRERRSTFTLLVIIVVIIGVRYAIPNSNATVENIAVETLEKGNKHISGTDSIIRTRNKKNSRPFYQKTFGTDTSAAKASHTLHKVTRQKESFAIELNRADTALLAKLPGIGRVLSARIVKYRNFLGGFARIDQLKEVYGLPEETYELIKNRVTADSSFITRININTAEYKELSRVRYLEKYEISSILKYRQLKGNIFKMSDLVDNKLITSEKAKKVGSYIRF